MIDKGDRLPTISYRIIIAQRVTTLLKIVEAKKASLGVFKRGSISILLSIAIGATVLFVVAVLEAGAKYSITQKWSSAAQISTSNASND